MKRIAAMLSALCLLWLLPMSAAAVPYTEQELEEFMEAIYCEQVWAQEYPDYQTQFIDIDFDGRFELVTMEAGEEYAPKAATIYAFMDAELSGRGSLEIGKLEVCRDPDTHEPFVVNRVEKDGRLFHQRLVYRPETTSVGASGLTDDVAQRLEDYGYSPVTVTKAQFDTVKVYEDCRALFFPAYQNTVYQNGEPPIIEPTDGDSVSTYIDPVIPQEDLTLYYWIAGGVLLAALVITGVVVLVVRCRKSTKRR